MTDRRLVMQRVRGALAPLAARTPMPAYDDETAFARSVLDGEDLVAVFEGQLARSGGRTFRDARKLGEWLAETGMFHGYCDPALASAVRSSFPPRVSLEGRFSRRRVDDYQFAITRAAGAIAETGSIILDDACGSRRLACVAPWIHVAALRRATMLPRVIDAIRALGEQSNVVWCTGPSKTADVEGILIQGVHGPAEQVALILD